MKKNSQIVPSKKNIEQNWERMITAAQHIEDMKSSKLKSIKYKTPAGQLEVTPTPILVDILYQNHPYYGTKLVKNVFVFPACIRNYQGEPGFIITGYRFALDLSCLIATAKTQSDANTYKPYLHKSGDRDNSMIIFGPSGFVIG